MSTVVHKEQIATLLIESCPSFKAEYEALDDEDKELPYIVAGDFSRHLLNLYKGNNLIEFPNVVQFIELLHMNGDAYVREYATIGILEAVQNIWGHSDVDPNIFADCLLPQSRQAWNDLDKFWQTGAIIPDRQKK